MIESSAMKKHDERQSRVGMASACCDERVNVINQETHRSTLL
jgi:hypothetical protein